MAEVEKDPNFWSKKYAIVDKEDRQVNAGEVTPVLKHPDAVIVVASPTGQAPPPAARELRVTKLSKALSMACRVSHNGYEGVSIVVHEGLYTDPTARFGINGIYNMDWAEGFSLEIIGMGQVRILILSAADTLFAAKGIHLTRRNLLIYDRQTRSIFYDVYAVYSKRARVLLVDVRMRGSRLHPIYTMNGSDERVRQSASKNSPRLGFKGANGLITANTRV